MTTYTINEASKIAGKARNTIKNHMKAGKLSYVINDNGDKLIDASELMRVYGNLCQFDNLDRGGEGAPKVIPPTSKQSVETELLLAQQKIDHQTEQIEKLEADIDYFKDQNDKTTRELSKATLALTDQRAQQSGHDRQEGFEKLIDQLQDQNKKLQQQNAILHKQRVEQKKKKELHPVLKFLRYK